MSDLELVGWPEDRILVVTGAPGSLKIPFSVRNRSAAPISLQEASLKEVRLGGKGDALKLAPVPVQIHLPGEGASSGQMRLRLSPATPPGRYEGEMLLGGVSRTLAIDVLPDPRLKVRPESVVIDITSGPEQRFQASFENLGNTPLLVDLEGAYPLGEEVQITADRLEGVAETGAIGRVFDRLVRGPARPTLAPAGVAQLSMPGGAAKLDPGQTRTIEAQLTLPAGLSPTARYHLFAPLYATELHLMIVTAAKPQPAGTPARRTKGIAA